MAGTRARTPPLSQGAMMRLTLQVDDKPGDVYSGVLQLVIRDIKQVMREGDFSIQF